MNREQLKIYREWILYFRIHGIDTAAEVNVKLAYEKAMKGELPPDMEQPPKPFKFQLPTMVSFILKAGGKKFIRSMLGTKPLIVAGVLYGAAATLCAKDVLPQDTVCCHIPGVQALLTEVGLLETTPADASAAE